MWKGRKTRTTVASDLLTSIQSFSWNCNCKSLGWDLKIASKKLTTEYWQFARQTDWRRLADCQTSRPLQTGWLPSRLLQTAADWLITRQADRCRLTDCQTSGLVQTDLLPDKRTEADFLYCWRLATTRQHTVLLQSCWLPDKKTAANSLTARQANCRRNDCQTSRLLQTS